MTLALRVLLKCVGDCDRPVAQVLAVHRLDGGVGCLEARVVNERESLGVACVRVALDLRRSEDDAERAERVVEQLLVHLGVQVPDEDVCANVKVLLVSRRFIYSDRFTVQLYHVHYLNRVVRIILSQELNKSIPLMLSCDPVLGHVNIHHGSSLNKKLPKKRLVDLLVQTSDVNGSVLVPLRDWTSRHF